MEDYKEKYEQAILRMNKWVEGSEINDPKEVAEFVFPELKESEDERIKEAITKTLKRIPAREIECFGVTKDSVYAWLEKQSEKTDIIENFDTEFEKQVSRLIASAINKEHEYNQGYIKWAANALLNYAKHELEKQDEHKCDCKYVGCHVNNMKRWCHKKQSEILYDKCNIKCSEYLKQGEQNPAWSEEDEKALEEVQINFEINKEEMTPALQECYNRFFNKIKTLNPQPKQKWSEEDEQMLQGIIKGLKIIEYQIFTHNSQGETQIQSTIDWLKSLKERMKGE